MRDLIETFAIALDTLAIIVGCLVVYFAFAGR